jgi:hypothetical protein
VWRSLVLICATGCNLVLGIEDLQNPPCFRDSFDSGTLAPADWDVFSTGFPATIDVGPGSVLISAPANQMADVSIRRRTPLDLAGGSIEVEVQISGVVGGLETIVVLEEAGNPGFGYAFVTVGTGLIARRFAAGNDFDTTVTIDPGQKFWRLAHDAEANTIELSVSANQRDYFPIDIFEGQPPPFAMELRLQAGVFNSSTANPGIVLYEGVTTTGEICE